jgi:hypothetical protein
MCMHVCVLAGSTVPPGADREREEVCQGENVHGAAELLPAGEMCMCMCVCVCACMEGCNVYMS